MPMSYDNIQRPNLLSLGDTVKFEIMEGDKTASFEYRVGPNYLNDLHDESNLRIFDFLRIPDRASLAAECYGYASSGGSWPSFRPNDFQAAVRLVNRIYDIIAGTAGKINDSAARVPYEDFIGKGFLMVLEAVKSAGHRVTPLEIAEILTKNKVQGFDLEDVSEILYSLASDEMKILTFHTDEAGQEVYFMDPEKRGFMEYINAVKNGVTPMVLPREHSLTPHILKFIREALSSVTLAKLVETFGEEGLEPVLANLVQRGILKHWEKGYYTRQEKRDEVTAILQEAGI